VRECAVKILCRKEQQDHRDDRVRDRQQQATANEEYKAGCQGGDTGQQRKKDAQAVTADPLANQHREQVRARRVVRHFSHRAVERSIVHEMSVLFDVVDEQQMMSEIGSAAWREQRRPRDAQQRQRHEDAHTDPGE
jgi:hypothetical protein